MIVGSGINDPKDFAPGWLGNYCSVMGQNIYPWSFHVLSALFAFSTVVGRRAAVQRATYTIWPPISIFLLGDSGVGKTSAIELAADVMSQATWDPWPNPNTLETENFRPGWSLTQQFFTPRGVGNIWSELQERQQVDFLEGAHIESEASRILGPKKGTEDAPQWIVTALGHRDLEDMTGMYGHKIVKNVTVSFGFGSTLQYLRKAMDADQFSGGLMHRFLITHEAERRFDVRTQLPAPDQVKQLVAELVEIRDAAPRVMPVSDRASKYIGRMERQKRHFRVHHLQGFWNRIASSILRLAVNFSLAQKLDEVPVEECERAENLLRGRLAPTLETIVEQLDATPEQKRLLDVTDSLVTSGPKGWSLKYFFRRIGRTSPRQQTEALQTIQEMGLAVRRQGRIYATRWDPGEPEPDQPHAQQYQPPSEDQSH